MYCVTLSALLPTFITTSLVIEGGTPSRRKVEVQEAVARELSLDFIPRPDDAADALAIAITAWFDKNSAVESISN